MRILVLHSRLSGYWMACMRAFVKKYGGEFYVIRKKVSKNAPFDFDDENGIKLFDFSSFSGNELINFCKEKDPDLVYVSGWSEQTYLEVSRHFNKKEVPIVCGLDNHWEGTIRQKVGKFYLKNLSPKYFTHLWIAGLYQYDYARHLGFGKENILTGVYSADVNAFSKARKTSRKNRFPKSFLFIGRFIERKGLIELVQAFKKLQDKGITNWTLTLIGNGPLKERLKAFDSIKVRDFVQPDELPQLMNNYGVFVLPSLVEPWGVVIHEAAAAGLPIISTYQCGATTAFIRNGYNGYLTKAGNMESLFAAMETMTLLGDDELYDMADRSVELSKQITPYSWASTLNQVIINNK